MAADESLDRTLATMRLVNRRTGEYVGPCPHCRAGRDRYHIWTQPGAGGRPAGRYWCRACGASGLLVDQQPEREHNGATEHAQPAWHPTAAPRPEHIPAYRQLYELTALWAHRWLLEASNPEPLEFLARRGVTREVAERHMLGYALHDEQALVAFLTEHAPELMPYAEEAGLLVTNRQGVLRTHWNLCGALIFPTMAEGAVTDLRARSLRAGAKTKSLAGSPCDRGAIYPFGCDELGGAESVILTESAEFKTLVPLAAYHDGLLSVPTIGVPGINGLPPDLGPRLRAKGVRCVIIAYDTQPRPLRDGVSVLAPEEIWTIKHGQLLGEAGLEVRVIRLPLSAAGRAQPSPKTDLDSFYLQHGARRLQQQIDDAPLLDVYATSIPRALLRAAGLAPPNPYPTHRARPRLIAHPTASAPSSPPQSPSNTITLAQARADIRMLASEHAQHGAGFLVLAHPPGTGKGQNTTLGLIDYLRADPDPGYIVWAGLRKGQIADQDGLSFVPLHGRHSGNCRKLPEAQELSRKGYGVRAGLCQRRCPHVGRCAYLRQFEQEADFFAAQPLLQATNWWCEAGVVVLDEFDPAQLARIVRLTSADLAAMARASKCPHAVRLLGWLGQILGTTADRSLRSTPLYQELDALAEAEGLGLAGTLQRAIDALSDPVVQASLPQLPAHATLADYQALPPGYLAPLLTILAREQRKRLGGLHFTSRIELRHGVLLLYLRLDHLIEQLARAKQPKIILDGTANEDLLKAIFPDTPIRIERLKINGNVRVIQVLGQDWAKTTLHGRRRERWYDSIAAQLRPGRPTLVVTTAACEADVCQALAERGHSADLVRVDHYGALRGSNAYKGYDVILAQVYHPNREEIIRTARALFADDATPLDERMILVSRTLTDASGASWEVQIPTFADPRLAALLESRRECEMAQAALRGWPYEHPDAQITILSSLPLPGLAPTTITLAPVLPSSNEDRIRVVLGRLTEAARQLLDQGQRVLDALNLARAAGVSVATVRKHWAALASSLHLRPLKLRSRQRMPHGGQREHIRAVLIQRGRSASAYASDRTPSSMTSTSAPAMIDHAHNKSLDMGVIYHSFLFWRARPRKRHALSRIRHQHPPARAP